MLNEIFKIINISFLNISILLPYEDKKQNSKIYVRHPNLQGFFDSLTAISKVCAVGY